MDFLDPKAKRRRSIQLYTGYALMATLISIVTLILVFQAYGFDVDRKTGEVIQNGLIYVDSGPDKASVLLNNQEQRDKTNNRFTLPSGPYDLRLKKDGYRDWTRSFALDGGEVERFTYPLLLPASLTRTELQTFDAAPQFVSQSPDRRWAITSQADSYTNYVEYDLNTLTNGRPAARQFILPDNVFTVSPQPQSIELVEWSNDNKHILVKHTFGERTEFVIISRDQPATSLNLNAFLGLNPTTVTLRDKKFDQWYLYTQEGGVLQAADTKKTITPLLNNVTAFKSHDDNTLLYSMAANEGKNQRIMLRTGNETYVVKDVANGAVSLDIARYDGSWYIVVGSDAEQRVFVYRNPVNVLQKRDGTKPTPRTVLRTTGPVNKLSFSQNTQFIVAQSGQHFEVFDAEANQNFKYDISEPSDNAKPATWMDGHRLSMRSGGNTLIFDFDGSNKQLLSPSLPQSPIIFNREFQVMYTLDASATAGKFGFYSTQLRTNADQ